MFMMDDPDDYIPRCRTMVVPLPHDQENGWIAYCSSITCKWEEYTETWEQALSAARKHMGRFNV